MDFEFDTKLKDGRNVTVIGVSEVEYRCDCYASEHQHPHVIEHAYDSVVDELSGLDVQITDEIRAELDGEADTFVYAHASAESA